MNDPSELDPIAVLTARIADVLRRQRTDIGSELDAALAAIFAGLREGHTGVHLRAIAATAPPTAAWRDPAVLRERLLASGVVALDLDVVQPLVLDAHDRIYLRRHRAAEQRVAQALRERARGELEIPPASLAALRDLPRAAGAIDWQLVAIAAALRHRLCVVTGGPGTGKTTTISRLLGVLQTGAPKMQVALVAPTGKAAARMSESLQRAGTTAVPHATTLHRLLGYLPTDDSFRRGPQSPLPHDLVVVDEASMVDLELMAALLAALRPDARLVLLGDRDQLASVAAGQVLGDLCRTVPTTPGVGPGLAAFARRELQMELPVHAESSPFAEVLVALRQNWRFASAPGLSAFAAAIADGDTERAMAELRRGHADLELRPATTAAHVVAPLSELLLAQCAADSPRAALAAQARLRILCAVRHGPFGRDALVTAVEDLLRAHGQRGSGPFYRGQPILVTANDHQSGLFNGDLGVVWPDADGRLLAWFAGGDGAPRSVLPLRLPPHETAWAMTVHKSQGSEFEHVVAVLPDRPGPLLHAQLVYTAATRARRKATLVADDAILATALAARPDRSSGLFDLLLAP